MPKRIQRKRTKGWKMPERVVYVGRGSKWGNPFKIGDNGIPDAETAVRKFEAWCGEIEPQELAELTGHDLACWCPLDRPCHADVLLRLANQ